MKTALKWLRLLKPVICVTRVEDSSCILLRAIYESDGQKFFVKLQGNGQKEHDPGKMILLMVHVQLPNGELFATPTAECMETIEMVRQEE
ncbi:MAG: hypothetical protein UMV23_01355 [Halanaerobium sp.]|nr:hypothetical protein [Halanaerobium sp.]